MLDLDVDYLHFSPTGQALRANLSARDRRGFERVAALRLPLSCNDSARLESRRRNFAIKLNAIAIERRELVYR